MELEVATVSDAMEIIVDTCIKIQYFGFFAIIVILMIALYKFLNMFF